MWNGGQMGAYFLEPLAHTKLTITIKFVTNSQLFYPTTERKGSGGAE